MYHARVKDPVFFRLGTCGGIGLDGGQLVITDEAVDGMMRPYLELVNFNLIFKQFNRKLHSFSNYLYSSQFWGNWSNGHPNLTQIWPKN